LEPAQLTGISHVNSDPSRIDALHETNRIYRRIGCDDLWEPGLLISRAPEILPLKRALSTREIVAFEDIREIQGCAAADLDVTQLFPDSDFGPEVDDGP
jgi:hypothetical protein